MIRIVENNTFITILLLASITLIAVVRLLSSKQFSSLLQLILSAKYTKVYFHDSFIFKPFDGFLFLNFIINGGLYLLWLTCYFYPQENDVAFLLLKIMGILFFIFLVKYVLEKSASYLLKIKDLASIYLFSKTAYKLFIGLCLVPINFILGYALPKQHWLTVVVLGVLLFINTLGMITFVKLNFDKIKLTLFRFILYLCAFEIIPCLTLYYVMLNIDF